MKLRRLLIVILVLIISLGCASIVSLAEESSSKIKLEWEISEIKATYESTQTWNAEKFQWEETKTVEAVDDQTAKFTLTNYSSKAVKANVAFAVEEGLEETLKDGTASFDKNDITIKKSESETITATLSFNADAFAELSEASETSTYGKYTVTIGSAVTTYSININLSNPTGDVGVSAICAVEIIKAIDTTTLIENLDFKLEGEDYTYEMSCDLTENVTYDWYISSDGTNYTFITTTATNSYTRTMLASDDGCYIKCVAYDSYTCYTRVSEQISMLFL